MIRRNKNQILHIKARDGSILESEEEICKEVVEYFKSILAPQQIDNPASDHVWHPSRTLSEDQRLSLTKEITEEEEKLVI